MLFHTSRLTIRIGLVIINKLQVFEAAGRCTNFTTIATTLRGLQCSNGDSNFEEFIDTILIYLGEQDMKFLLQIQASCVATSRTAETFRMIQNFLFFYGPDCW